MDEEANETRAERARSWRQLALVMGAAALTVVGADQLLHHSFPPDAQLLQAHEGIAAFEAGNPRILLLGSSHARSFRPVARRIAERTGRDDMVIVPEEGGLFRAYDWIVQNRLKALLLETRPDGRFVRDRLEHFLLVTTVYDTCPYEGLPTGLPAQAWRFSDFTRSVANAGVTPLSRNYLRARWNEIWRRSALVQDRGVGRIIGKLRWAVSPKSRAEAQQAKYRQNLEDYFTTCFDPDQLAAFERTLAVAKERGVVTTVVLFALDPIIVSEKAQATTLKRYGERVAELQKEYGFRTLDLTQSTPLVHGDFMDDLDHVTAEANEKFAAWALAHDLSDLLGAAASRGDPP